jgi:hypothetical protein
MLHHWSCAHQARAPFAKPITAGVEDADKAGHGGWLGDNERHPETTEARHRCLKGPQVHMSTQTEGDPERLA